MALPKNKITDTKKSLDEFIYRKIKHDAEDIDCLHCKYERSEQSLKDKIESMKVTDTIKTDAGVKTFVQMEVYRGRYDDVMGWQISWR